jgi:hypothetical protein
LAISVPAAFDDSNLDVLRHGATPARFGGSRDPSTLGTFPSASIHGHVLQLPSVRHRFLAALPTGVRDVEAVIPRAGALAASRVGRRRFELNRTSIRRI